MKRARLQLSSALLLLLCSTGCGGNELECGAGTALDSGDRCVPLFDEIECGEGTHEEGGVCVRDVECGPDTVAQGGQCKPTYPEVECGENTLFINGRCETPYPQIECGPLTVEEDGVCVLSEPLIECSDGTVLRGEECVHAALQFVGLPFEEGQEVRISQGHHGNFSHKGSSVYALDFPAPEGTVIVAARAGRILQTRSDSDTGCGDPECASDANFIRIDHGDGTKGVYFHLQQDGVLVEEGETVCKGQPIGLSGNTGFSTGPHLHFEVNDIYGQSLPLKVEEFGPISAGIPFSGQTVASENVDPGGCDNVIDSSTCAADTFAHLGVALDEGVPCASAARDTEYVIGGQALGDGGKVLVGRFNQTSGEWAYDCLETDDDARFNTTLLWPSEEFTRDTFLVFARANEECRAIQGWDGSPKIILR